mmetsp:Transcript_28791/g.72310  ORF Transcript_28791/g.72310 Transcript_28791/m.72310 type:complete len:253 (-) Transcript_28791:173-931(-)
MGCNVCITISCGQSCPLLLLLFSTSSSSRHLHCPSLLRQVELQADCAPPPPCDLLGAVPPRRLEHEQVPSPQRDVAPPVLRLPPRLEVEFASLEVDARFCEHAERLIRERHASVQISVRSVVTRGLVAQRQARRQPLRRLSTAAEVVECLQRRRVGLHNEGLRLHIAAVAADVTVGDRREGRVQRAAELLQRRRQRLSEVRVAPQAEARVRHVHGPRPQLLQAAAGGPGLVPLPICDLADVPLDQPQQAAAI